jgi:hypothetical protein
MTRDSKYDANVVLFIHLRERKRSMWLYACQGLVHAHKGGEYIANHSDQKDFFASIFVGERSYVGRYDELKCPERQTKFSRGRRVRLFSHHSREYGTHKTTFVSCISSHIKSKITHKLTEKNDVPSLRVVRRVVKPSTNCGHRR